MLMVFSPSTVQRHPFFMPHPVLAVVEDLFFSVKINEAAKRAGLAVQFVKSQADALGQAAAQRPDAIAVGHRLSTRFSPLHVS